jgi:hypothetical protein
MQVNNNSTEKTRKAPAEKASTYDEGYTMYGLDGVAYVVKTYKNGVKRWIKKPSEEEKPSESEKPSEKKKNKKKKSDNKKSEPSEKEDEKTSESKEKKVAAARKVPADKASAHDEGYTMDGLDGVAYVVKTYKNGVTRWVKKIGVEDEKVVVRKIVQIFYHTVDYETDQLFNICPDLLSVDKAAKLEILIGIFTRLGNHNTGHVSFWPCENYGTALTETEEEALNNFAMNDYADSAPKANEPCIITQSFVLLE